RDAANNNATATLTVIYDPTAPTVSITAPTSETTYTTATSPLALGGAAGDNIGVTQVAWSNNRGGSGPATTTNAWATWSTAGIAPQPGSNLLTVTATDAASNTKTATLTVTYDPTAPTVSLTAPAAGAALTGTTTLTASAADNISVVGVQFLLDGAALGAEVTGAGPSYSLNWNTAGASNGAHSLSARARDAAGNTTTSSAVAVSVSNATVPIAFVQGAYAVPQTPQSTVSVTFGAAQGAGNLNVIAIGWSDTT